MQPYAAAFWSMTRTASPFFFFFKSKSISVALTEPLFFCFFLAIGQFVVFQSSRAVLPGENRRVYTHTAYVLDSLGAGKWIYSTRCSCFYFCWHHNTIHISQFLTKQLLCQQCVITASLSTWYQRRSACFSLCFSSSVWRALRSASSRHRSDVRMWAAWHCDSTAHKGKSCD